MFYIRGGKKNNGLILMGFNDWNVLNCLKVSP